MIMEMVVASVIAGTSACSDHFDNVSRFNPTELSDYQKCVHQVHGNTSGRVGHNIWIETDGVYTYIPMKNVAGRSQDRIEEIITSEVIVNVIDNGLQARVTELEKQAEAHRQERASLIASLASEGGILEGQEIASVADLVNKLNLAINAASSEGAALKASLNRIADLRVRTGGIIDFVYGDGYYRDIDAVIAAARTAAPSAPVTEDIVVASFTTPTDTTDFISIEVRQRFEWIEDEFSGDMIPILAGSNTALVTSEGDEVVLEGFNGARVLALESTVGPNTWDDVLDIIEEAYAKGYQDGYDKGYRDGYTVGYNAGQASVQ